MAKGYSTIPKVHLLGNHAQKDSGMTNRICEKIIIEGRELKKDSAVAGQDFLIVTADELEFETRSF